MFQVYSDFSYLEIIINNEKSMDILSKMALTEENVIIMDKIKRHLG